jgi:hypothetical protein
MSWKRVESATVDPDLREGLEVRIADPLWLLGKQWQVGEFKGEDAASPVLVEADLEHAPITRLRPGPPDGRGPVVARDAVGVPLETAVEREAVLSGPAGVRLAADAGLQLWRFLDSAQAPPELTVRLRSLYRLALGPDDGLDPVGRAQLELLARRSLDARRLHAEIASGGRALAGLPGMKLPAVRAALDDWSDWYAGLYSEPPAGAASWDPRHMEYRFQIAAGVSDKAEVQLDAREYTGGHLDWYGFDLTPRGADMGARGALEPHSLRVIPTPARYAGQAASRWWQVENADVWFGDIATAPEDLARAAVGAYGMQFGVDWFLVPVSLPSGVVVRTARVKVLDTFGDEHDVDSCAKRDGSERGWRFFELSGDAAGEWLLLPPALPGVTQSRPIEEVALLRDEVANLGWAAELRVESAAARTIDRAARARAAMPPPPEPLEDAWRYTLATAVPEHHVPLVPVTSGGELFLQRGRMVSASGAVGRILDPGRQLLIYDDEVPATGARVTRTWQMARTAGGDVVLWVGRRKSAGRPVRSPGLVYDEVTTGAGPPA